MTAAVATGQRALVMAAALGVGSFAVLGTGVPAQRDPMITPLGTTVRFADYWGPATLTVSTITGPGAYDASRMAGNRSAVDSSPVVQLKRITGFTWDQIAKALGVSRRTIHLWAAGGNMTAANEETTLRLINEAGSVEGLEAGDRRLKLFEILDRERAARASTDTDINHPARLYPSTENVMA